MLARRMLLLIVAGATMAACTNAAPSTPISPTGVTTVSVAITNVGVLTHPGETRQLKAIAKLSDGSEIDVTATAVWRSLDSAVVTVSATGLVTARAPGACDVEAASGGVKTQAKVEVLASTEVDRVEVTGVLTFNNKGEKSQLKAIAHHVDGSSRDVTNDVGWTTTNPGVVAITNTGTATAEGDGDCDILATLGSKVGRVAAKVRSLRIIDLKIVGKLSLDLLGERSHLKAIATLSNGEELDVTARALWSSTHHGIAKVSLEGLLEAVGPGDCEVTAVHADVTARAVVKVTLGVLKVVKLNIVGGALVRIGDTLRLKAIAEMSDGSEVDVTALAKWTTSDLLVSLIGEAGELLGLGLGTCDVVAVHGGVTATLNVKVTLLDELNEEP